MNINIISAGMTNISLADPDSIKYISASSWAGVR